MRSAPALGTYLDGALELLGTLPLMKDETADRAPRVRAQSLLKSKKRNGFRSPLVSPNYPRCSYRSLGAKRITARFRAIVEPPKERGFRMGECITFLAAPIARRDDGAILTDAAVECQHRRRSHARERSTVWLPFRCSYYSEPNRDWVDPSVSTRRHHWEMRQHLMAVKSGTSVLGTFETCRLHRAMSEFEGKAENICSY
jgi:hypothetical protein